MELIPNDEKELKKLEGIGEKISKKIIEILNTGCLKELQENTRGDINGNMGSDEKKIIINLFQQIRNVGSSKAEQLYSLGYRKLEDIKYEDLTKNQYIGLKYFYHLNNKIQRKEIDLYNILLETHFTENKIKYTIAGSYRRKKLESGDINIIIIRPKDMKIEELVNIIISFKYITYIFEKGENVIRTMVQYTNGIAHQMDFEIVMEEEYYFTLLYFTGSKEFNIKTYETANKKSFKLNKTSLTDPNGNKIYVNSEKDIFDILNIKYLEPEEQIGRAHV